MSDKNFKNEQIPEDMFNDGMGELAIARPGIVGSAFPHGWEDDRPQLIITGKTRSSYAEFVCGEGEK